MCVIIDQQNIVYIDNNNNHTWSLSDKDRVIWVVSSEANNLHNLTKLLKLCPRILLKIIDSLNLHTIFLWAVYLVGCYVNTVFL